MDNRDHHRVQVSAKRVAPEELPPFSDQVAATAATGYGGVECGDGMASQPQAASVLVPRGDVTFGEESESGNVHGSAISLGKSAVLATPEDQLRHQSYSLLFSLPVSPSGLHIEQVRKVLLGDKGEQGDDVKLSQPDSASINSQQTKQSKFQSQSLQIVVSDVKTTTDSLESNQRAIRSDNQRDKTYDSFKTWSGRLERQLSNLRGRPQEPDLKANDSRINEAAIPAIDRYFDALEGPELDTLRASEVSVLPEDKKWPFLLRFPISSFGMCLGISSQAILWKTLATSPSMSFLHVSPTVNLVLWSISLALMGTVSFIYSCKLIFYFEAVRREYYHPVRVNFFFAPWIACLFLALGVPPSVAVNLRAGLWYVLMAPILFLELKIYGQWMSGGQRRLSKVANPSNHLSIVGNFVGALLGASMGLKEGPIFFFAVGLAHYIVLFVTLYQRLPTNETLPKELHPVFFLFVAAPSVACMAWARIRGDFDHGSKIGYFIALFLYVSLAVRINFFRGFKFSLAWWAYTFPMTGASVATIKYSMKVTNVLTQSLSFGLSAISTFTVTALLVTTIIHAFVLRDLFPNDISIAITQKKPKFNKILAHLRSLSSEIKDAEASLSKGAR
ncbi:C4-dicarboxylate transporter malic acid transport protein [Musa troglodytarum]|uniref:C4-dicarboxylate transporter malic acid transport protein n=1 Tax=Musa troglodytarum TaxID=320322 RepID=A0A9E7FH57_9LILI|nr:C4-dicarboxylate transporter malic acid transport protein [Musa troglodytarum]